MKNMTVFFWVLAGIWTQNVFAQNDLDQGTTGDLWDLSNGTVVTSSSPTYPQASIENTFGATLGTLESEETPETTIFADGQPAGTVHFIEWETPGEVTLGQFNLYANHDAAPFDANERGFTRFVLYAENPATQQFEQIFELEPTNPYSYLEPNSFLLATSTLDEPVRARRFRAEFTQWGDLNGPRLFELDGFPPAAGVAFRPAAKLSDIDDNDAPEIAILRNRSVGPFNVRVADASTGNVLNNLSFLSGKWSARQLLTLDGLGNGPAVGIFATRDFDRVPMIQIKQAEDGNTIGNLFPWSSSWEMIQAQVVNGVAPSGGPAIATLATRKSDGLPGIELRDASDNNRFRLIYPLGFGWTPHFMDLVDVNGSPALAVLHTRDLDGLTVVQVRNIANGALVRNIFPLGFGWTAHELKRVPDLNANNADEIAVRMTRDTDGLEVIQIRDSQTNVFVANVYPIGAGGGGWRTQQFEVADNQGTPLLAILSTRNSDGQMLLQTRNPMTGMVSRNTFFIAPPWTFNGAFEIVPDYTGNNVDEAAIMVFNENASESIWCKYGTSETSTVIRNVNGN